MLQELRAHPDQLPFFLTNVSGYEAYFNHSGRAGYAGTALYYKTNLEVTDVTNRTGIEMLDAEGRTIAAKLDDIVLLNFYTPNGNSSPDRLAYKLQFYDEAEKYISSLLKKNPRVIIGGDLNVGATEDDVFRPEAYKKHSGFLPEERQWFNNLLACGFVDTFRIFTQGNGHYTWWHMRDPTRKDNKGWRFDYFLVSKKSKKNVKKAEILRDVYGSDHCPILLEID